MQPQWRHSLQTTGQFQLLPTIAVCRPCSEHVVTGDCHTTATTTTMCHQRRHRYNCLLVVVVAVVLTAFDRDHHCGCRLVNTPSFQLALWPSLCDVAFIKFSALIYDHLQHVERQSVRLSVSLSLCTPLPPPRYRLSISLRSNDKADRSCSTKTATHSKSSQVLTHLAVRLCLPLSPSFVQLFHLLK